MTPNLPTIEMLLLQLKVRGFWQRKGLGQHFLTSGDILKRIAAGAQPTPETLAVEIGPGPGTLTTLLAGTARQTIAVEYDERLRPLHEVGFGPLAPVRFLYADAVRTDLASLAREAMQADPALRSAVLTGNLPYQITSPLLFAQCGPSRPWRRMVFMMQREVAERIVAPPDTREYGILSVKLAFWWRVTERFDVEPHHFQPPPKVHSTVLMFEPAAESDRPPVELWPGVSAMVDAAFSQRRKKMINSLFSRWVGNPGKERMAAALEACGLESGIRAEDLSPAEFLEFYRHCQAADRGSGVTDQ